MWQFKFLYFFAEFFIVILVLGNKILRELLESQKYTKKFIFNITETKTKAFSALGAVISY